MKVGKISIILLALGVAAFVGSYFLHWESNRYENEKIRESRERDGFVILHGSDQMNYLDIASLSSIVLGSSLTLAAIWARKR